MKKRISIILRVFCIHQAIKLRNKGGLFYSDSEPEYLANRIYKYIIAGQDAEGK